MKHIEEENTVAVVARAIDYLKISVSFTSIKERLVSHPDYPSLKSICDSFEEWKVLYQAARLSPSELVDTNVPFIAHLNDNGEKLVFVPKLRSVDSVKFFDSFGRIKSSRGADFWPKYSGVSILLARSQESGEKNFRMNRQEEMLNASPLFLASISIVLIFFLFVSEKGLPIHAINIIPKLVGLAASLALFLFSLKINNPAAHICERPHFGSCKKVITSKGATLFAGLSWSEVGITYFISTILLIAISTTSSDKSTVTGLSFIVLPFSIFSLYYQWKIVKSWCILCLIVQLAILFDASLFLIKFPGMQLSLASLIKLLITGFSISAFVILYKIFYLTKERQLNMKLGYQKLKRNPVVFNQLLKAGKKFDAISHNQSIFILGNQAGNVVIDAFLNFNCNPCREAFKALVALLEIQSIRINLLFVMKPENSVLIDQLSTVQNDQELLIELISNWYEQEEINQITILGDVSENFREREKVNVLLFQRFEVKATPTIFIDGYMMPSIYQISDLTYLINR
jgi:uncharacterized membrane protein